MATFHLTHNDHFATIEDYFYEYLENKSPDCILYSKDGGKFKIHKEILCQTNFLRKILSSAKENCCGGMLEILCPCSKKDLGHLIDFLYKGEINFENENDSVDIQENLSKIFGFPKNLSLKNPNQVRRQWMTQIHCSPNTDILAEIKTEVALSDTPEYFKNPSEMLHRGAK